MALATTCPQCKTSFKVIPDQLKLRRGLVRCGVCQHIFSGIDYLRYVDDSSKGKPAAKPPPAAERGDGPPAKTRNAGASAGTRSPSGAPQTIISPDDELKTAFFLSDSTFGPYSQTRPQDVNPPRSIVSDEIDERAAPADFTEAFFSESTGQFPVPATMPGPGTITDGEPRTIIGRGSRQSSDRHSSDRHSSDRHPSDRDPLTGQSTRSSSSRRARNGGTASTLGPGAAPAAVAASSATARSALPAPTGPAGDSARPRRSDSDVEAGTSPSRRPRSHASRLLDPDADDPDVAAANALARQARESARQSGSRRSSRSGRSRSHDARSGDPAFESLAAFFADPARRATVIGLALLAMLQLTLLFRNEIGSQMPSLRPALSTFTSLFGLNVDTIRSLSSLTIESTELQTTGQPDQVNFNAILRNKDGHSVRWPAMELTLTDPSASVLVRKVILPSDYLSAGNSRGGIEARSEWQVRIALDTGGLQLAGYSVALFYP